MIRMPKNSAKMNAKSPNMPSIQAMKAARAYLEKKQAGVRTSKYRQKDAANDFVATERMVKKAVKLLQSDRNDLVQAVEKGIIALSDAEQMLGNSGRQRRSSTGQHLYLITEIGKGAKWAKVGIGSPRVRFDEAQRGNPRRLRLAGAWWFQSKGEARAVERALLNNGYKEAPGGSEWREGITRAAVNDIARLARGERVSMAPEFDIRGFRRRQNGKGSASNGRYEPTGIQQSLTI